MKPDDIAKWRDWLGEDFSPVELAAFLAEHPEMNEGSEALAQLFGRVRDQVPPLSQDFTSQVMKRLENTETAPVIPLRRPAWRRWAMASGLAAAAAVSLVWYRSDRDLSRFPGVEIRQAQGPSGEPVYFVRFAIESKGAKEVALAGDFNQWNPVSLSPASDRNGLFTVELPLNAGIYSYAFVVDGRKWLADEAAERLVDDGFGERNSVIQL